jgi:hypothetical protein
MGHFQVGFMEILRDSRKKGDGFLLREVFVVFSRAEDLLAHQAIGCFLIRLSESRFGFSLSFR